MAFFSRDRSTIQTMFSMEQRITSLENHSEQLFDIILKMRVERVALYKHLGIEAKENSGITFIDRGKD